jgi:hypothetical protein
MQKVARLLRAHEELLLNWFRTKGMISNGVVEGLNDNLRAVTRRSYGFRTYDAMKIALYHTLGRLPEPKSNHSFARQAKSFDAANLRMSPVIHFFGSQETALLARTLDG